MRHNSLVFGCIIFLIIYFSPLIIAQTAPQVIKPIRKVHLIFKTHLDVGYTHLAADVINLYNDVFLPEIFRIGEKIDVEKSNDRFIWTAPAWIIWQYLQKADKSEKERMDVAIQRGDIVWHAGLFTPESEIMDSSMMVSFLQVSKILDSLYNKKTVSIKFTDVPGQTRSIIPYLKQPGIKLIHVGVNGSSPVPEVPLLSRWKGPEGSEVYLMNQTRYGGTDTLPNTDIVVKVQVKGDNLGPHTEEEIRKIWAITRQQYPGSEILASNFNAVAEDIEKYCKQIPILNQEIGDTWIHGYASNPKVIAQMKELSRLRQTWIKKGKLKEGSEEDLNMTINLALVTEHTFGLNVNEYLNDWDKWEQNDFLRLIHSPKYKKMEMSWDEKNLRLNDAIVLLPEELQKQALQRFSDMEPTDEIPEGFKMIIKNDSVFSTTHFTLQWNHQTGAMTSMIRKYDGKQLAGENNPLGEFSYQTYSSEDYHRYIDQYGRKPAPSWIFQDFGKPGLDKSSSKSRRLFAETDHFYHKKTWEGDHFLLEMSIVNNDTQHTGGYPEKILIEYFFATSKPEADITLSWFDKPAYRMPEALWFKFNPLADSYPSLIVNKIGYEVDALNVISLGGRRGHAIDNYLKFNLSGINTFKITSLDAPVVLFDSQDLSIFNNQLPDPSKGCSFSLFNNFWGTNYRMWYGENMRYRFNISLE